MLTDFGTRDGYVGAMKGVLHALSPNAALTDISHEIASILRSGNVLQWQGRAGNWKQLVWQDSIVKITGQTLRGIHRTYGDMMQGELLALIDSSGFLEIAIHRGNAATSLGAGRGSAVELQVIG